MSSLPPVEWVKRRNQKTIRIRVKEDRIVVSAPFFASKSEMVRFYEEKKDWILSAYAGLMAKHKETENRNLFSENKLMYEGNWIPVQIKTGCKKTRIIKDDNGFLIELISEEIDSENISYVYAQYGAQILAGYFYETAEKFGYKFSKLSFRNQKTKWGSCSGKGNISLNWRLIKCPRFVQEYIFVHELCHLKHLNHSKAYWDLVESHLPDYQKAELWLKKNGPVVFQSP